MNVVGPGKETDHEKANMRDILDYPPEVINRGLDRLAVALDLDPLSRAVVEHPATPDLAGLRQVIEATEAGDAKTYNGQQWCACGIALFIAAHPDDLLHFEQRLSPGLGREILAPVFAGYVHYQAVAKRFRLTDEEARELFGGSESFEEETTGYDARLKFLEKLDQFVVDHQESSECRACSEIYYVDPDKAAEAMYCPTCEKKHAEAAR